MAAPAADVPPVRIELETGWAWCGAERLDLTPKAFAVLRHLVDRPQRLVTKDELLAAAWGDTVVSEAALTSCIRDLRRALSDSSQTPRYIETVHRRGFRYIGPVAGAAVASAVGGAAAAGAATGPATFVGREAELAQLRALFATAAGGERRLVFVTGEAGIGKTTLVDAFLAELRGIDGLRIGRGQCVEQYGTSEPYLPVLEALGRMGREPGGDALVRVLRQYAPTWLAQLPALLGDDELDAVQRRSQGTTRERMLREVIEGLDALGADAPLVLVLEDLHWCDSATVDVLALLARRRDPARLLIVGTYRPADVALGVHPLGPLKQELQAHGQCDELALEFLDATAIDAYLTGRFPRAAFPPALARQLHENTGGNALFLVNVVDDLVAQGAIRENEGTWSLAVPVEQVAATVPRTLWEMVDRQIDRLSAEEQAVLAVGAVAGAEFSAALVGIDGIDPRAGERCCNALARRGQFVRAAGVADWPDGTVAGRYAFIHAIYRNVLYQRVSIGQRVGRHLRIGARLEAAHVGNASSIAGELAMHFELGRDLERAIDYRRQAAETALRQHAYREAVANATRALELLGTLPESAERDRQELTVQTMLGAAVIATSGWAAPDVARAYARARELCARTGVAPAVYPVLTGLCGFYLMRGEIRPAGEVSAQLVAHAERTNDAAGLLGGHNLSGLTLFYSGRFTEALSHFERAEKHYDPVRHSPNRQFSVDHDPGVSCAAHAALTLLMLGYMDRGARRMRECLDLARAIDHPLTVAMAYNFAATFHQFRREQDVVRELEVVRVEYSTKHDFHLFLLLGEIYRGWLVAEDGRPDEGLAKIQYGLAAFQAIGAELGRPTFLSMEAVVLGQLGRTSEALSLLDDARALADATGLHYWDAELQRLRGELLVDSHPAEGEACLLDALAIARRQQAKSYELRAAMSVTRFWRRRGDAKRGHALLSDVYEWFTEGFDTPDMKDAKALLAERSNEKRRRS